MHPQTKHLRSTQKYIDLIENSKLHFDFFFHFSLNTLVNSISDFLILSFLTSLILF